MMILQFLEWTIFIKGQLKRLPKGMNADEYDFDHPSSLNIDLLYDCLVELLKTGETQIPVYCFKTHSPLPN